MKKLYLLLTFLCLTLMLKAQVTKTLELTAGNLSTLLTETELSSITDLTLKGTIDARDFKTMRDQMPLLAVIDIRAVSIVDFMDFWGGQGPSGESINYDENTIPWDSFCTGRDTTKGKTTLTLVILPPSITEIGGWAFAGCKGLSNIEIPSSVRLINSSSFSACTALTDIDLPSSVTVIGPRAFDGCRGLGDVSMPSVITLMEYAFNGCSQLTSIHIPSSVNSIEDRVFKDCIELKSIYAESLVPVRIPDIYQIFEGVDKSTCILYVPFGTKERYAEANGWKDFTNIVESDQGFLISPNILNFDVEGGSNSMVNIHANADWTATSDQAWLSITPASGTSSTVLVVTTQANQTEGARVGTITFSAPGMVAQTITVTQASPIKTVESTPGGLANALTAEELANISHLKITGTMNARDFGTLNRLMPMLTDLDISEVLITSYQETEQGCRYEVLYPANELPGIVPYCPNYNLKPLRSLVLPRSLTSIGWCALSGGQFTSIDLPPLLTTIGDAAFRGCSKLTAVTIPGSVTEIGSGLFSDCSSLTFVNLPSTIRTIKEETFSRCTALQSIKLPSSVTSIESYAFYGCSSLKEISLPPSLTLIGNEALNGCTALTSVDIPSSVTTIKNDAFRGCTGLTEIILPLMTRVVEPTAFDDCVNLASVSIQQPEPPDLFPVNFAGVNKATCILYVPFGSAHLYAEAVGWKEFQHIVEMPQFTLSSYSLILESTQGSAIVELFSQVEWAAHSNEPWLTVAPASGSGNASLNLTLEANPRVDKRIARVTFSNPEGSLPDIIVTQQGTLVTVELTAGDLSSQFPNAELKRVNRLAIKGTMDARDFKFIRDELALLTELDLSEVTITAYSGVEGTKSSIDNITGYYDYPANELPPSAFSSYTSKLVWIALPSSLTSIGENAFLGCLALKELNIPSNVVTIGPSAFASCTSLTVIQLPPSLISIENGLLYGCSGLSSLDLPSTITSIGDHAFFGCQQLKFLEIPDAVTSIGKYAFTACYDLNTIILPASLDTIKENTFDSTGLTSIRIPASVKYIDTRAFFACYLLTDFYAYPVDPPKLAASEVFYYLDQTKCTLYVPHGSKERYIAANQWKDFTHIIEMVPFTLSVSEVSMEALAAVQSLQITTDGEWYTTCDKNWLTVSPASGESTKTVTFTCLENTTFEPRTATVTFNDKNGYSQTVTILQKARINSIPIANAGQDQTEEEGELVQLDGSASMDADGDPLVYTWTEPVGIMLSSTSEAYPSFTAPSVDKDTEYIFMLVVNDGKENSAADKVIITISNKTIELGLSADAVVFERVESSAKIMITGNAQWNIVADKDWLSVTPSSGEGEQQIILLAQANETVTERVAIVTVSAPEAEAKTITVTQHGIATDTKELTSGIQLSCYPNPFTQQMGVEIANPSLMEISVEIYSISGQKIRTLARALKGAKISLGWNGEDEQGKKVPRGIYLVKINGEVRKVMKREE